MANNIKPTAEAEKNLREEQAKALLANPIWTEALEDIERTYTNEWKITDPAHVEYRERAYYIIKALDKLKAHINEHIVTGKLNSQRAKETMKGK